MSASPLKVHLLDDVEIYAICKRNEWKYESPRGRGSDENSESDDGDSSQWYVSRGRDKRKKKRERKKRDNYCGFGQEVSLCGSNIVVLECEKGLHDYGKCLFCGREWCSRCGTDGSEMHKRKYGRLMDKVFFLGDVGKSHGLGYWVFTVPPQVRTKLRSKECLQKAGRKIRNILKHHNFNIGVSRWHWFGDGQIFEEDELDFGVYHPHLNCLTVGRWVSDAEMKNIKNAWRKYLESILGESIDVVDVWFHYYKDKGQWWHKATYITRPTFKSLEGNEELAKGLFDFRNVVYWGWGKKKAREEKEAQGRQVLQSWIDGLKKEEKEKIHQESVELVLLSQFFCSECSRSDGTFVKLVAKRNLDTMGRIVLSLDFLRERKLIKNNYGAGFYRLEEITPDIILNAKPMSDGSLYHDSYDTS